MKTWIKFCGTTSMADALASIEAGADALGFIFAASSRQVTPEKAQEIIRELPSEVEKIGVFLDAGPHQIRRVVDQVDLTGIQMHGQSDFPPEVYSYLPPERRDGLRKIKTLIMLDGFQTDMRNLMMVPGVIDAFLLDSGTGSGRRFDWQAARAHIVDQPGKLIIAGGLTPDNVGEAMRIFRPWGVDVVSGVEDGPGRKGPDKLNAFVAAVRNAEKEPWAAQH